MEKMLKVIADMTNEDQEKAFAELEAKLGTEITNALREKVFYIKLFTNQSFYNAVVEELGNRIYESARA